ncbi:PilE-like protein [Elusimicrobium minutum Pei191]|uniref:PilE-like protein n=1 Tax=Elusimicrobium minutum (strain Pei191) TaxID=445932 RepID=B2KC11_ELUMP|nr:prepilin-type N-terminal cleavage/methylation domain-containing protein [Elusimicrobium minutum]ACC98138.1 PilE-like protein [Elusimicrobium minutum Pei191]
MMKTNKKGFTLVELLVVILIIGILASLAVVSYRDSLKDSRLNEAKIALGKIGQANYNFIKDYPVIARNIPIGGHVTNAVTNSGDALCEVNLGNTSVLTRCGYINKDNWDRLAYNIYVCNLATGAGGGCCNVNRLATMKQKGVTNTYCAWLNASTLEIEEENKDKLQ